MHRDQENLKGDRMAADLHRIRDLLLKHRSQIANEYEFPWLSEKPLSMTNANKFVLGAIIDYQIPANIAWENAEELATLLGSGNIWKIISDMSDEKWSRLRKSGGGYFHRWWEAKGERSIAKRIRRIALNITLKFSGDARNIWKDKNASDVYETLRNEVRINLSNSDATINMIVLALLTYGHVRGTGNVKADLHVRKVLSRVFDREVDPGLATELTRAILPSDPWRLDLALYDIGKKYCQPQQPNCSDCPIACECLRAKLSGGESRAQT